MNEESVRSPMKIEAKNRKGRVFHVDLDEDGWIKAGSGIENDSDAGDVLELLADGFTVWAVSEFREDV